MNMINIFRNWCHWRYPRAGCNLDLEIPMLEIGTLLHHSWIEQELVVHFIIHLKIFFGFLFCRNKNLMTAWSSKLRNSTFSIDIVLTQRSETKSQSVRILQNGTLQYKRILSLAAVVIKLSAPPHIPICTYVYACLHVYTKVDQ